MKDVANIKELDAFIREGFRNRNKSAELFEVEQSLEQLKDSTTSKHVSNNAKEN